MISVKSEEELIKVKNEKSDKKLNYLIWLVVQKVAQKAALFINF